MINSSNNNTINNNNIMFSFYSVRRRRSAGECSAPRERASALHATTVDNSVRRRRQTQTTFIFIPVHPTRPAPASPATAPLPGVRVLLIHNSARRVPVQQRSERATAAAKQSQSRTRSRLFVVARVFCSPSSRRIFDLNFLVSKNPLKFLPLVALFWS